MTEWYELKKVSRESGGVVIQAFRDCDLCGETIDSCGGPGSGSICLKCGDAVKKGWIKGSVVWNKENLDK